MTPERLGCFVKLLAALVACLTVSACGVPLMPFV